MEKYFKEDYEKKLLLSEYLDKSFVSGICSEEDRKKRTEYLIDTLGDVEVDYDLYKLFISQFQRFGGRYDVRVKPETIKGIYEIVKEYPMLTTDAIDEIWFRYISDLFEEYDLVSVLHDYIKILGKGDETFSLFLEHVDKAAERQEKRYLEDSLQADELVEDYGGKFVSHIKYLITCQHYEYDEIKKYLPSSLIIKKDEQHISDISKETRIFFGCCQPVSYTMFDTLIDKKTLESYTDTPSYYISTGEIIPATFTKQKFLDSLQKVKIRK